MARQTATYGPAGTPAMVLYPICEHNLALGDGRLWMLGHGAPIRLLRGIVVAGGDAERCEGERGRNSHYGPQCLAVASDARRWQ